MKRFSLWLVLIAVFLFAQNGFCQVIVSDPPVASPASSSGTIYLTTSYISEVKSAGFGDGTFDLLTSIPFNVPSTINSFTFVDKVFHSCVSAANYGLQIDNGSIMYSGMVSTGYNWQGTVNQTLASGVHTLKLYVMRSTYVCIDRKYGASLLMLYSGNAPSIDLLKVGPWLSVSMPASFGDGKYDLLTTSQFSAQAPLDAVSFTDTVRHQCMMGDQANYQLVIDDDMGTAAQSGFVISGQQWTGTIIKSLPAGLHSLELYVKRGTYVCTDRRYGFDQLEAIGTIKPYFYGTNLIYGPYNAAFGDGKYDHLDTYTLDVPDPTNSLIFKDTIYIKDVSMADFKLVIDGDDTNAVTSGFKSNSSVWVGAINKALSPGLHTLDFYVKRGVYTGIDRKYGATELKLAPPTCGDGVCSVVSETCSSCPQDCGLCPPPPPPPCDPRKTNCNVATNSVASY